MKTQRIKTSSNFTAIHTGIIRDWQASLNAKGLLFTVMSLPDDEEITIQGLSLVMKESKPTIYATIKELEKLGYCKIEVNRDSSGTMEWEYTFYEEANNQTSET